MEKPSCKTYFSVNFGFDRESNAAAIKEGRDCPPEELGIFCQAEAKIFLEKNFGVTPEWKRHRFRIGLNETYHADVNEMIRVTLKDLFGKEEKLRELKEKFPVETVLEVVPHIVSDCGEPAQNLSLAYDIVDFLFLSDTAYDLDYYVL